MTTQWVTLKKKYFAQVDLLYYIIFFLFCSWIIPTIHYQSSPLVSQPYHYRSWGIDQCLLTIGLYVSRLEPLNTHSWKGCWRIKGIPVVNICDAYYCYLSFLFHCKLSRYNDLWLWRKRSMVHSGVHYSHKKLFFYKNLLYFYFIFRTKCSRAHKYLIFYANMNTKPPTKILFAWMSCWIQIVSQCLYCTAQQNVLLMLRSIPLPYAHCFSFSSNLSWIVHDDVTSLSLNQKWGKHSKRDIVNGISETRNLTSWILTPWGHSIALFNFPPSSLLRIAHPHKKICALCVF